MTPPDIIKRTSKEVLFPFIFFKNRSPTLCLIQGAHRGFFALKVAI